MMFQLTLFQPMNGLIVAAFKPASPPTVPTPDAVWEGLAATNVDFSFTVPSFIEVLPMFHTSLQVNPNPCWQQWARDPEKVLVMKKRRGAVRGIDHTFSCTALIHRFSIVFRRRDAQ